MMWIIAAAGVLSVTTSVVVFLACAESTREDKNLPMEWDD